MDRDYRSTTMNKLMNNRNNTSTSGSFVVFLSVVCEQFYNLLNHCASPGHSQNELKPRYPEPAKQEKKNEYTIYIYIYI